MKRILQHIDIIYFFGLFVLILGYYMSVTTFMNGDFLYNLSLIVLPYTFVYLGLLILLAEFIITKHYKSFFAYVKKNLEEGITGYVVIISLLSYLSSLFLLPPKYSLYLILFLLFVFTSYVLIYKTSKYYIITLILLIVTSLRILLLLNGVTDYDRVFGILFDINFAFYILFILTVAILAFKYPDKSILGMSFRLLVSFIAVNILLFTIQFNVYDIQYYHSDEQQVNSSNLPLNFGTCPDGHRMEFKNENNTFYMICVPLDVGLVDMRESGIIYLGVTYLGIIGYSLYVSTITLPFSSSEKKRKESIEELNQYLSENK